MGGAVLPAKQRFTAFQPPQQLGLILLFLLIPGPVFFNGANQFHDLSSIVIFYHHITVSGG
jgi:hypothetical protein